MNVTLTEHQTSGAELRAIVERQRSAFMHDGPPSLADRRGSLTKLKQVLLDRREDFVQAVSADFGHRSRQETSLFDVASVVEGINYLHRNLGRWTKPERRRVSLSFQPASNYVLYQPLGVIGIISPWNYPVALAMIPLATALAAGNRAMLKPSELTPRTSDLIKAALLEIFPEEHVAVVTGGASVGIAFSKLPFDHLLFTGSTPVGRSIMRAASDNLVPVTLELGGKSPVIIERGFSLPIAARRVAYGKLANAGQTCIAPDYALVPEEEVEPFVNAYMIQVARLYPDIGGNPDYTTIINDGHFDRLRRLLDDARTKGARVIELGTASRSARTTHPRTMIPALVLGATDGMSVMQDEIFGPILPVIPYRTLEDAIAYVNARPRPLALYFFGADGPGRRLVMERTTSGGVSVNETNLHYAQNDIPFGGVGESGMGAYRGHEGFKTLSHAKSVFQQSRINLTDVVRPPFGSLFERVVGLLLR